MTDTTSIQITTVATASTTLAAPTATPTASGAEAEVEGEEEVLALVSVSAPQCRAGGRPPCDVCCVVDVSGSMSTEATMQGEDGERERHGLTLLDVVKHAVRTVSNTLQAGDRLCVVSYSSAAKLCVPLTSMAAAGRAAVEAELGRMQPGGQTNLWDGLYLGMEELRKGKEAGRHSSLMLLTDGCPNVKPPRGHLPMLAKYIDEGKLTCSISTFGFGYSLDSPLLEQLARAGEGMYGFIPDSGFVGTCFVNALSNQLATFAGKLELCLEPLDGVALVEGEAALPGGHAVTRASWGASVQLGPLQYGQSKDIVVRLRVAHGARRPEAGSLLRATAVCAGLAGAECRAECTDGSRDGDSASQVAELRLQHARLLVADGVRALTADGLNDASRLASYESTRRAVGAALHGLEAETEAAAALLEDLDGQVREAISTSAYFRRWGCHYLPSLARAHQLQQCSNFKDPGVQHYGGSLFSSERDRADETFLKLPPPKPSAPPAHYSSGRGRSAGAGGAARAPRLVDMSAYHNCRGGCFHGDAHVTTEGGAQKLVRDVCTGDRLQLHGGGFGAVQCAVHYRQDRASRTELVRLPGSGLLITPYHPILCEGDGSATWRFPVHVGQLEKLECEHVYNFVMQEGARRHALLVDGQACCTLAHGLRDNDVIAHEYYGTERVLRDLQAVRGWAEGVVELAPDCAVRDEVTGRVCGMTCAPPAAGSDALKDVTL